MKIVMAPMNISGQPIHLVRELKRNGVDAKLVQYSGNNNRGHTFGYESDTLVRLDPVHRLRIQWQTMQDCLAEGTDIFHFWQRSFIFGRAGTYTELCGIDLPFIKLHRKKICFRFTGYDLRMKSKDKQVNPYSAFFHGWETAFSEDDQRRYIDFLKEYVDQFIVQDPELQHFCPEATIIPRSIDLEKFAYKKLARRERPLVLHSPSIKAYKGTSFILKAVEELKSEGLNFDFELIKGLSNEDAIERYKKADIVIDQLLIGWYGVLAIECMALGIPVMVYIRDDLHRNFKPQIPVENTNIDNFTTKLRDLVKDYDRRRELSEKGRLFVEEVHDVNRVTKSLVNLYAETMQNPSNSACTQKGLKYIGEQLSMLNLFQLRKKEIQLDRLLETLPELKAKSLKYDMLVDEFPDLKTKADKYETLKNELPDLKTKFEKYQLLENELSKLKAKYQTLDAAQNTPPNFDQEIKDNEYFSNDLAAIKNDNHRYDRLINELHLLKLKIYRYEPCLSKSQASEYFFQIKRDIDLILRNQNSLRSWKLLCLMIKSRSYAMIFSRAYAKSKIITKNFLKRFSVSV